MTNQTRKSMWILLLCAVCPGVAADTDAPITVRTPSIELRYDVNEQALPLESVQIYVTGDGGATWQFWGADEDRQPPAVFHAEQEGLYGFYILLTNAAGASGAVPGPGTAPQASALMDWTAPVAQVHAPRQVNQAGSRVLQLRWTALDSNLPPRPVELQFRRASEETWSAVLPEPLANTGRYDWRLPEGLVGPIQLRAIVTDSVGHRVESGVRPAEIVDEAQPAPSGGVRPGAANHPPIAAPSARQRAGKLFDEAVALREAGLDREAVSRFREVVRIDPQRADALVAMGDLLYRMNDADGALTAYETALSVQGDLAPALRGAAAVSMQRKDYRAAGERLRTLVKLHPGDAASWIKLGDVAVFEGDEITARDCYLRATQADPAAFDLIAEANNRLALMGSASRPVSSAGRR